MTHEPDTSSLGRCLLQFAVGIILGILLYGVGYHVPGAVVCAVSVLVGGTSCVSRRCREAFARGFVVLGRGVAWVVSAILLVPIYLLGFSAARAWQWVCRSDPLALRRGSSRTYWLPSDSEARTHRYRRAMFASETLRPRRRPVLKLATAAALGLLAAEVGLRFFGLGNPVLYVNDFQAGFYPKPHQDVVRYGGRVTINQYGMRSPDFSPTKPLGTFRIFMIGDSTLYGGSYVDNNEIYANLLNRCLREEAAAGDVEVLCMGVNAWGPFHKLGYVEKFGSFEADVAVVCLPIRDIYRSWYMLGDVMAQARSTPPRCALEELGRYVYQRFQDARMSRPSPKQRRAQGEKGIEAYCHLARKLRDAGCEVVFEILPSRAAGTTDAVPDEERDAVARLRGALAAAGFDNVGYVPSLFRDRGPTEALYHDPCHLNPLGHQIYSEYLKERLLAESRRCGAWMASTADRKTTRR